MSEPNEYWLSGGSHSTPADGRCAMEWVSYLAGEEHTDTPRCVDHFLNALGQTLNDCFNDENRQRLRPYLARMIGTRDDGLEDEREEVFIEWSLKRSSMRICRGFSTTVYLRDLEAVLNTRPDLEEKIVAPGGLLDKLLPLEPITIPVVAEWREICQVG